MRSQPDLFEQRLGERRELAVVSVGVVDVVHRPAPVPRFRTASCQVPRRVLRAVYLEVVLLARSSVRSPARTAARAARCHRPPATGHRLRVAFFALHARRRIMNSWLSKLAILTAASALVLLGQGGPSPDAGAAIADVGPGYWIMTGDGTGFSFRAPPVTSQSGISCSVSTPGTDPAPRCSGIATFPDGSGYWISGYIPWWHEGILDTGGDATAFAPPGGCETSAVSNAPIVGVASAREGAWLAASDGAVFGLCGAGFHGSMGGTPLNKPVVGIAATPDGKGYWLVASDGGIFAFGDAAFHGSMGERHSTSRSWGSPPRPMARATGSWHLTGASSPSGMPPSTARWGEPSLPHRWSASLPIPTVPATGP